MKNLIIEKPRKIKINPIRFLNNHKLSDAQKRSNLWYINKANEFKKDLIDKATPYELELMKVLNELHVDYEFQHIVFLHDDYVIKKFYIADFFMPKYNLIIEMDGKWHAETEQAQKDIQRSKDIKALGYNEGRFWNRQIVYSEIAVRHEILKYITTYLDESKKK